MIQRIVTMTKRFEYRINATQKRVLPAGWSGEVPEEIATQIEAEGAGGIDEQRETQRDFTRKSIEARKEDAAEQKAVAALQEKLRNARHAREEAETTLSKASKAAEESEASLEALKAEAETAVQEAETLEDLIDQAEGDAHTAAISEAEKASAKAVDLAQRVEAAKTRVQEDAQNVAAAKHALTVAKSAETRATKAVSAAVSGN